MSDLDIVKETENYRVRLELEDYAEKPYNEGATPILSREFRSYGYNRWEAFNKQAEGLAETLNEIHRIFEDEEEIIERFVRIFLGAYSVEFQSSENCRYVAFDTAEWREEVGLTDEYLAKVGPDVLDPAKLSEGCLTEVIAWANGEVYGYIVEKKFETVKTFIDPVTRVEEREVEDEEWIEVEYGSCWGFYGYDYAKEAALEALENYES